MARRKSRLRRIIPLVGVGWIVGSRLRRSERPAAEHPVFARFYTVLARLTEPQIGPFRATLLEHAEGVVVEIGAGSGENFKHYPAAVAEIIAIEPDSYFRGQLERRADEAAAPVKVVDGTAEEVPLADGCADTVVMSLVMCSVEHPAVSASEARRLLKPGGKLLVYEHVVDPSPGVATWQQRLTPAWKRAFANCHLHRDTAAVLEAEGFDLSGVDTHDLKGLPVVRHHLHGVAIAPGA